MKKLLITGVSGFLGWNICSKAKDSYDIYGTVFSHRIEVPGVKIVQINLTNFQELKNLFREISPEGVIHTAADSRPEYCQLNRDETKKINTDASINIAGLCSDYAVPFVFTSTDLVFDGLNPPYKEEDSVSPVSIYGEQKVAAEEGILKVYPGGAICRMPLMYGLPSPVSSSFIQPVIEKMKKGEELKLFTDEFRTPVSGSDAAAGLLMAHDRVKGILHLGGPEIISRYDFAVLLKDILNLSQAKLVPVKQKDIRTVAPRPHDVSLDSRKAMAMGFRPLSPAQELKRTALYLS